MTQITYLMGADPVGAANAYFTEAKGYFTQQHSDVIVDAPAAGASLEWMFDDLRARSTVGSVFELINLVTHATGFSSLEFGLLKTKPDEIITKSVLNNAVAAMTTPTPMIKRLGPPAVTERTHIRLYGCDVGKDRTFVSNLGQLFGGPADITAPMRVAVFRHRGATFTHELARTWAVPWPRPVAGTTAQQWPAFRAQFVTAAEAKFGPAAEQANPGDLFARQSFVTAITETASNATLTSQDAFFFGEMVAAPPNVTQNFESSVVVSPGSVDDLTVVNRITPADYSDKNAARWIARIAVLGRIMTPAELQRASQYTTVTIAPQRAPSPGPKPVPSGGGPPADARPQHSLWEQLTEEFLAAGGQQADLDELIAGLAVGEVELLPDPDGPVLTDPDDAGFARPAPVPA